MKKEIDFICLVLFSLCFALLLALMFLAVPEDFQMLSVLFLCEKPKVGRFITLIATLAFRELWLCNTLSSALKHLNNPYPHVHKNQISKTLFHGWRLLQAERARVAVDLVLFWNGLRYGQRVGGWVDLGEMAGLCGGMQGAGACACWLQEWWKHYCVTVSDPVRSKLSSGHYGNSRRGG